MIISILCGICIYCAHFIFAISFIVFTKSNRTQRHVKQNHHSFFGICLFIHLTHTGIEKGRKEYITNAGETRREIIHFLRYTFYFHFSLWTAKLKKNKMKYHDDLIFGYIALLNCQLCGGLMLTLRLPLHRLISFLLLSFSHRHSGNCVSFFLLFAFGIHRELSNRLGEVDKKK